MILLKKYRAAHQARKDLLEFNKIVKASYRPNIGRVLPGELPVIAPRWPV